ncbi:MAG: FlgD immunoglobulin-like domain containing protein, partial [candidate division WOR-3 bacterium]
AEIAGLRFLIWPNPSRKGTMVSFSLPNEARVRLAVFDITGRLIRTLVQGEQAAGGYTVTWNGRDDAGRLVPTGTYLYKLETDAGIRVTKSVLVR